MKPIYVLAVFLGLVFLGCVGAPEAQQPAETQEPVVYDVVPEDYAPEETQETGETTEPEETEEVEETPEETGDELSEIESEEFSFRTTDQWEIHATIYYAIESDEFKYPDSAIILIHELGKDQSSFDSLVPVLHKKFPRSDIITYDIRGHGKSTNHGSYTSFTVADFKAMKDDIIALKQEVESFRYTIEKYSLVGSSIGGSVALNYAAEEGGISRVVMISPGTAYHDFDITEDAETYSHGLFMAVGTEDRYSASSADELYRIADADPLELQKYYGLDEHGMELIDATASDEEPLEDLIVEWLKS